MGVIDRDWYHDELVRHGRALTHALFDQSQTALTSWGSRMAPSRSVRLQR
jgi:hypothetical protein